VGEAQGVAQFILRKALHADKQAAAVAVTTGPAVDVADDLFPAPEIEVTYAKVRTIGEIDRLPQCGEQLLFDVIENARHSSVIRNDQRGHGRLIGIIPQKVFGHE
jgi:hypothetical protein